MAMHRFQDGEGPDDVGAETARIVQCIVDMGFGGKCTTASDRPPAAETSSASVISFPAVSLHVGQRLAPVGQGVEYGKSLSMMLTMALCTKFVPINPAPPVTSNRSNLSFNRVPATTPARPLPEWFAKARHQVVIFRQT